VQHTYYMNRFVMDNEPMIPVMTMYQSCTSFPVVILCICWPPYIVSVGDLRSGLDGCLVDFLSIQNRVCKHGLCNVLYT
jgi:hypothetical protein